MTDDCLFCRIIAGTIPSNLVYTDDHAVAFRDINPQAPTHVLVIPRQHVESVGDLPDDLAAPMLRAIRAVADQEGVSAGYRVLTNKGADAGQSVFHLHWHVLGGRKFGWPPG